MFQDKCTNTINTLGKLENNTAEAEVLIKYKVT